MKINEIVVKICISWCDEAMFELEHTEQQLIKKKTSTFSIILCVAISCATRSGY